MRIERMARRTSFKTVEAIGRTLPDAEVTTTWGQPTLKVRGVLVRLSTVRADALRDLVTGAYRFVSAKTARKSAGRRDQR